MRKSYISKNKQLNFMNKKLKNVDKAQIALNFRQND